MFFQLINWTSKSENLKQIVPTLVSNIYRKSFYYAVNFIFLFIDALASPQVLVSL